MPPDGQTPKRSHHPMSSATALGLALSTDPTQPVRLIMLRRTHGRGSKNWLCEYVDGNTKEVLRFTSSLFVLATLVCEWRKAGNSEVYSLRKANSEYDFLAKFFEGRYRKHYTHPTEDMRAGCAVLFPTDHVGGALNITCQQNCDISFFRASDVPSSRVTPSDPLFEPPEKPISTIEFDEVRKLRDDLVHTKKWNEWYPSDRPMEPKSLDASLQERPAADRAQQPAPIPPVASALDRPALAAIARHVQWLRNLLQQVPLRDRPYKDTERSLYVPPVLQAFQVIPAKPLQEDPVAAWLRRSLLSSRSSVAVADVVVPGKRLFVLGEAGTGKSTFLEHVAWQLAGDFRASRRHSQTALVPFVLRLGRCGSKRVPDLQTLVTRQSHRLSTGVVQRLCVAGRAVILIDELDQAGGGSRRRERLLRCVAAGLADPALAKCPIVVASRPGSFDWSIVPQCNGECASPADFSIGQIRDYIDRYPFAEPKQALQLKNLWNTPALRAVVARPLVLPLVCSLFEQRGSVDPLNEGEVLERTLAGLLHQRRLPEPESLFVLGRLAWHSTVCSEPCVLPERAIQVVRDLTVPSVEIERFTDGGLAYLFARLINRSDIVQQVAGRIQFTQDVYREYLAGRYLAAQGTDRIRHEFMAHARDPRWWRVLMFMMSRLWADHQQRGLAAELIRWLLAEHASGRDDAWQTLLILAGWLSAPAVRAKAAGEGEFFTEVSLRVLPLLRYPDPGRQHGPAYSLIPATSIALLTLAEYALRRPLAEALAACENTRPDRASPGVDPADTDSRSMTPRELEDWAKVAAVRAWMLSVPRDVVECFPRWADILQVPKKSVSPGGSKKYSRFWPNACEEFHQIDFPDKAVLLAGLLRDGDPDVERAAVAVLAKMGGFAATAAFQRFLLQFPSDELGDVIDAVLFEQGVDIIEQPMFLKGMTQEMRASARKLLRRADSRRRPKSFLTSGAAD